MGLADANEGHGVNRRLSPSDPYADPHNAVHHRRNYVKDCEAVEVDPPQPYADGIEIPPSLQIPPEQQMSQEEQNRLFHGILERLSIHPDIYRPPGWKPPRVEPEPEPARPQRPWNFGRGHIIDRPRNMVQSVLERNHEGRHGSERTHQDMQPYIGRHEVLQMMRQLAIPRHSSPSNYSRATNWRRRASPPNNQVSPPHRVSPSLRASSPLRTSPSIQVPPALQTSPPHRTVPSLRASPSIRVSPPCRDSVTTGRVSKRGHSTQKC